METLKNEKSYSEIKKENFLILANEIKKCGFEVFISQSPGFNYGFYTTGKGEKCIYFQPSYYSWFDFSSTHNSKNLGTGHRLSNDGEYSLWEVEKWAKKDLFDKFLNCTPFYSKRKNEVFLSWKTKEQILKTSLHSNYIKL